MVGFESFAIVELMGHQAIAGKVTEETLFGVAMLRVDVPETKGIGAFTRYYGASAIYCIRPTSEEIAKAAAEKFEERPVQAWILPTDPLLAAKVVTSSRFDDEFDDGFDDDDDYTDADDRPIPGLFNPEHPDDYLPLTSPPATMLSDKERSVRRAKELMERKFIIFDTETTGFDEDDEIIQIAIVDETGATVLKSYIKPTQMITNTLYHGITDEMVKDAPSFAELYPKLVEAMNGKLWLAYNMDFDERMLRQDCRRHKQELLGSSRSECVMLLYADFYGDFDEYHGNNRWQKLNAALSHLDIEREGKEHDAESDAKATLAVLKAMAATETEKVEAKDLPF